eukprot:jgi/Botrbrau1/1674/Bobra.116_2s0018.1
MCRLVVLCVLVFVGTTLAATSSNRKLLQLDASTTVKGLIDSLDGVGSSLNDLAQQWTQTPDLPSEIATSIGLNSKDQGFNMEEAERKFREARHQAFSGDFILSGGLP